MREMSLVEKSRNKENLLPEISEWLKRIFETENVPPFEVNNDTVALLHQIMTQHKQMLVNQNTLKQQITKETEEYDFERVRLNKILKMMNLQPNHDFTPIASRFLKSLSESALALDTMQTTRSGMILALMEFQNEFDKSKINLEALERSFQFTLQALKHAKDMKLRLEKQYSQLEAQLPTEHKNVESLRKSTKFHLQKKKDYEKKILVCEERLKSCGFSNNLSHSEIVDVGEQAEEINKKLQPLRIQLQSYQNLPPDINLARIKLQEKISELTKIEEEMHDLFHKINLHK